MVIKEMILISVSLPFVFNCDFDARKAQIHINQLYWIYILILMSTLLFYWIFLDEVLHHYMFHIIECIDSSIGTSYSECIP
jgi:hypothetical protein